LSTSPDNFHLQKSKKPYHTYHHTKLILQTIPYLHEVIPQNTSHQKLHHLQHHHIDLFLIPHHSQPNFHFLKQHSQLLYFNTTQPISTTQIKQQIPPL
ncbi:glycerol-3-phosphate cytidylyltransferase, partial [Bacillus sp. WP8]|uniref:glycerol-3-phosphate cytidylyltransferase n=1 Tax=Bacillus sp. WP8 TaxID=756828 RepID=UPI001C92FCC8